MKKKITWLLILVISFLLFSCPKRYENRLLDIAQLKNNKKSWEVLGIKDYSFSYSFGTCMPEYVVGHVEVKNGIGKVSFEGIPHHIPDKDDPKEKKYYITTIEEAFDNILSEYLDYKRRLDNKEIERLYYHNVEYDENYFFIKDLSFQTYIPISDMTGQCGHSFQIQDFKKL